MLRYLFILIVIFWTAYNHTRLNKIERHYSTLDETIRQRAKIAPLNDQRICADGGTKWIKEHWNTDKRTVFLEYSHYYIPNDGNCYILISWHYYENNDAASLWKTMWLFNVFENTKVGERLEVNRQQGNTVETSIVKCQSANYSCAGGSEKEFIRLSPLIPLELPQRTQQ